MLTVGINSHLQQILSVKGDSAWIIHPQEARLLTQVLPNVAAQFRTTLGNMHAALSSGDDPDACILRQSYYRLLRTVTNLTDAVMLAEDTPLPRQDTDLTVFFNELCRQAWSLCPSAA